MIKQRQTAHVFFFRQTFEELSNEIQITHACGTVGFMRRVSIEIHYKTIHDVDDDFEGETGACREYTLPREDPGSEIIVWIVGHTKIGSDLQIKTSCSLDIYGINIQMPSTSGDGCQSWNIISRDPYRYVEELHTMIQLTLQKVMNWRITQASGNRTRIPIDDRKWNDILAYDDVQGKTLEWRLSK